MVKLMNIPFSPPDIGEDEINEVIDTLRSGWITTGPKTKQFEKALTAFIKGNRLVCLNSATAAMEMTLRVLGIGEGDEVILPAYTYTASCSVIYHVGATPVMVDIQKDHHEMNYDDLDGLINERTKLIIPVDIGGVICDYDKLYQVLERNKAKYVPKTKLQKCFDRIIVMSDGAHSFGSHKNGIYAGNFADFTCFSFHAVKNLTTAEGGAATWKTIKGIADEDIYKEYQILSLHGQTKDALGKMKLGAWEYDIISPAYKCNMTDITASIGLAQLKRYPAMIIHRAHIVKRYNALMDELNVAYLKHFDQGMVSNGHLYLIRPNVTLQQRNEIIVKMANLGIACNVHYKPLPLLTAYINKGFKMDDYPNAYDYYHNEISLPIYSTLTDQEVDYIIASLKGILQEYL